MVKQIPGGGYKRTRVSEGCFFSKVRSGDFVVPVRVLSRRMTGDKYWLLTKREDKVDGYRPRTRPISSHLDRKSLFNKGLIIWLLWGTMF